MLPLYCELKTIQIRFIDSEKILQGGKTMRKSKVILALALSGIILATSMPTEISATSQKKSKKVEEGGYLYSNAWRSTDETKSGNTYQWDYQVSAEYTGSATVSEIRTTWHGSASLRSGAGMNIGISGTGVNASASSNWQTVTTVDKYWSNTNGAKNASWRSNMIVTPYKDYRANTISIINEAYLKVNGNKKPYTISAGA